MSEEGAGPTPQPTLAEKLDVLFRTMHPADRGEFSYREVSAGCAELGVSISHSYLHELRKGVKDNPTLRQVEALARFFKVPVGYFVGSAEEVESVEGQLAIVQAMRDSGVRDVALRAAGLNGHGLKAVAAVIDELQQVPGMRVKRSRRQHGQGEPMEGM